jgi:hypothetical protein
MATLPAFAKDSPFIPPPAPEALNFKEVNNLFKLVDAKNAFSQHNRILIGGYRVGFSVARSAYAKEQGGSQTDNLGGGWQSVTNFKDTELRATVELKGVDTADLQAMTQKAYQDLIQRLQGVGREVITMDQIKDSKIVASKLDVSRLNGDGEYWSNIGIGEARELSIVTWPRDTPLWFMFGDTLDVGGSMKAALNALSQKNFGFIKEISGEQDAGLLDISVMVRFADAWSLRAKTLRSARVGVVPVMKMTLARGALTTAKVTRVGTFPGPAGSIQGFRKAGGFDLGSDWAAYSSDIKDESSWTTTGETIELTVTAEPADMEAAVLKGLLSLNAAIAAIAAEYPAK